MMSNWNGVGVPESGQKFINTIRGKEYSFVGLSSNFNWVGQDSFGTLTFSIPRNCKQIKTPEDIAIDDLASVIMRIPSLVFSEEVSINLAKYLRASGYHNQPKEQDKDE